MMDEMYSNSNIDYNDSDDNSKNKRKFYKG